MPFTFYSRSCILVFPNLKNKNSYSIIFNNLYEISLFV